MKQKNIEELLRFIDESPTCFHAVENVRQMLDEAGFQSSDELLVEASSKQSLTDKAYIIRNDSSLIAYKLPKQKAKGFHIMASHSDSPCFKIKTKPEIVVDEQYVKLNVEKYGGMILSTWMDRTLGIAGRVITKKEDKFISTLVNLSSDCCVIPNLSVHFNREINKGFEYNPQVDMLPLFSGEKSSKLMKKIAEQLSLSDAEILGSDLYLYSGEKSRRVGLDGEFILAPRLDDLQCAFGTLQGFIESKPQEYISVYCLFNNEEVGSRTRQGADSDFLEGVLKDIWEKAMDLCFETAWEEQAQNCPGSYERYTFRNALANSFLISADNAHALHPNHPEKSDVTNKPYLNKGIVLKFNGNAQYTTEGFSQAYMQDLCNQCSVQLQTFANRSDVPGGSTLGNIVMSHVSVPSADIGLPQLAMHSAMETAGAYDAEDLITVSKYFYGM